MEKTICKKAIEIMIELLNKEPISTIEELKWKTLDKIAVMFPLENTLRVYTDIQIAVGNDKVIKMAVEKGKGELYIKLGNQE